MGDWPPDGFDPNEWGPPTDESPAGQVDQIAAIIESAAGIRTLYLAYVDVGFDADQALTIVCTLLSRRRP